MVEYGKYATGTIERAHHEKKKSVEWTSKKGDIKHKVDFKAMTDDRQPGGPTKVTRSVPGENVMNPASGSLQSWVLFGGSTWGTVLLGQVRGLSKLYESCSEDELILKTTTRFSFRQCYKHDFKLNKSQRKYNSMYITFFLHISREYTPCTILSSKNHNPFSLYSSRISSVPRTIRSPQTGRSGSSTERFGSLTRRSQIRSVRPETGQSGPTDRTIQFPQIGRIGSHRPDEPVAGFRYNTDLI